MSRSSYLGHIVIWLSAGAAIFLGRRVGAIPFPDATLIVFSAIYYFGALWIIRQRHGGSGLFAKVAAVILIAAWCVAIGDFLMPDSYPYTFGSRPDWYVQMMDIIFYSYAACPPLVLLPSAILPASTGRMA